MVTRQLPVFGINYPMNGVVESLFCGLPAISLGNKDEGRVE